MYSNKGEKRNANDLPYSTEFPAKGNSCDKSPACIEIFGLPKHEKLKGKQVVRALFSKGQRYHQKNLTLIYLPAEELKVGFIASKSIGGAVQRNRTKRILREAYRMNRSRFKRLHIIFYAHGALTLAQVVSILKKFSEVL